MTERTFTLVAKKVISVAALYIVIGGATLLVFDLILMSTGLFPPTYELGNPDTGWSTKPPNTLPNDWCMDQAADRRVDYRRNDIGIRSSLSSEQISAIDDRLVIAAVGDSHSDLCMPNSETHQGVLETQLAGMGFDNIVLSNGVGRFSPLQAYLLYTNRLRQFRPKVVVLNLYTGNDFIDILRVDDRPHFFGSNGHYQIQKPQWMRYADPEKVYRSRVAFIFRRLGDEMGIRDRWIRLKMLSNTAGSENASILQLFRYVSDVQASVEPSIGYSGALAAQFLNQQLFMHHFPDSVDESLRRISALMALANAENPGIKFVMSPIPSYQLVVEEENADAALKRTMDRLPINYDQVTELEGSLYQELKRLSSEHGWLFIDNLTKLRAAPDSGLLYNKFDYHLTSQASHIIGLVEAQAIANSLR